MNTVFFSWQSWIGTEKRPKRNWGLIGKAIELAIRDANKTLLPVQRYTFDDARVDAAGNPLVFALIKKKVDAAAIAVFDMTVVHDHNPDLPSHGMPNPNVCIEYGIALGTKEEDRLICVYNSARGDHDKLPFDLRNRRGTPFDLVETDEPAQARKKLASDIKETLLRYADKNGPPLRIDWKLLPSGDSFRFQATAYATRKIEDVHVFIRWPRTGKLGWTIASGPPDRLAFDFMMLEKNNWRVAKEGEPPTHFQLARRLGNLVPQFPVEIMGSASGQDARIPPGGVPDSATIHFQVVTRDGEYSWSQEFQYRG